MSSPVADGKKRKYPHEIIIDIFIKFIEPLEKKVVILRKQESTKTVTHTLPPLGKLLFH